ncbi:MAG: hypothetical protein NTX61_11645 [Bacteroidetes bacterium]|nr:hypothetical protein [Bacteroidota bacterium]
MRKSSGILLITIFFGMIIPHNSFGQKIPESKEPMKIPEMTMDTSDRNNNFYDNTPTYPLNGGQLEIAGEVENPGFVDLTLLPKHSVIIKETLLTADGKDKFIGAYRYDGYSLFDILNNRYIKKKNRETFPSIIDLYVEIENDKGEKVIISWGEIYYPVNLHNIIIATDVSCIVPSKTKDHWPLPGERKLIAAKDLITERNISNPVKITVKSYEKSIPVNRGMSPLYSPSMNILSDDKTLATIKELPKEEQLETVHTIFYGRGRGIHSTEPFTGIYMKELLGKYIPLDKKNLKTGLFAIIAMDGYRSVFSFSEVMNRNDQSDLLLVPCKDNEKDGGKFRLFPGGDFFSDRAVKAVAEIRFSTL